MKKSDLLELFKYYKGEKENPNEPGSVSALWWGGEKALFELCANDTGKFDHIKEDLKQAIKDGYVSGPLNDDSISIDQRTVIYFLDLWHGKWFPYDNLDVIFTYMR